MLETFTITPTEFQISILETGWIDNVNVVINSNNNVFELPCYHYKKIILKNSIRDVFIGYHTFYETSCYSTYYFVYYIEGKKFETNKSIFKIENFYDV